MEEDIRNILYSGDAENSAILTIGNETISEENIKSIKVSNPILDSTSSTFYIGTFISEQIEIELYKPQQLDFSQQLHLQIGTKVDEQTKENINTIINELLPELTDYLDENCEIINSEDTTRIQEILDYINDKITELSLSISGINILNDGVVYDDKDKLIENIENKSNDVLDNIPYQYTSIGYFNIETTEEDYYNNSKIVALDNGIKFKPNVDYSPAMIRNYVLTEDTTYQEGISYYIYDSGTQVYLLLINGEDYEIGDEITGNVYVTAGVPTITCEQLLIWLCDYFGVELGTYPNINKDISISTYNASVSGKQYISYIAEIMGGNAKIGRDGKLYIIPFKQANPIEINATTSKSWSLGEKYELKRVTYFDAIRKYNCVETVVTTDEKYLEDKTYYKLEDGQYIALKEGVDYEVGETIVGTIYQEDESGNTYYIRTDNPFVVGTNEEAQQIVKNLYDELKDIVLYNVEVENIADYTIDPWQYISYKLESNPPFVAENYIDTDFDWETAQIEPLEAFNQDNDFYTNISDLRAVIDDEGHLIDNDDLEKTNGVLADISSLFITYLEEDYDFTLSEESEDNYKLYDVLNDTYMTFNDFCKNIWDLFKNNGTIEVNYYQTINNIEYTYEQNIMSKVSVKINNDNVTETTNIVKGNEETKYNILRTNIDQANNKIEIIAGQYDGIVGQIETLTISQNGLENSFKQTGGNNLIKNSSLLFEEERKIIVDDEEITVNAYEFWDYNTQYTHPIQRIREERAITGSAIQLNELPLKQSVDAVPDNYCLSFKYKRLSQSIDLHVIIDGEEKELELQDEYIEEEHVYIGNVEIGITNTTSSIILELYASEDEAFEIYDLMLNVGDSASPYSQNANETTTDTVKIGKGIQVEGSNDTITRVDSDGFRVLNKNNQEEVLLRATDVGTETKQLVVKEKATINLLVIQEIDGQVWINSNEN